MYAVLSVSSLLNISSLHVLQILVQHIKTLLPGLKSRISAALVSVAKEHASYGDITESKVNFYVSYCHGIVLSLFLRV